ncbi:MAG: methionine--tRNA ligase [Candidatus Levyibacteriota bacterium]
MDTVGFKDFEKLEIRIGKVLAAEKVAGADKLLKLEVDFGAEKRQVISGIAEFYKPETLIGKESTFIMNMEQKVIKGLESQGMLMAVDVDGKCVLLSPDKEVPEGSVIK